MERVLIVIPDNKKLFAPFAYAPLGPLYLAAVLERDGFAVKVWDIREDFNDFNNPPEADIYCLTAVTSQIDDMKDLNRIIKKKYGDKVYTIIGGVHATWLPDDCVDDFDCVVQDEAEGIITKICTEKPTGIHKAERIIDLDTIPHPARHLMPDNRAVSEDLWGGYKYNSDGHVGGTLMTSRGCPFNCAFCANVVQKTRFRSADNVVEEIELMMDKYNCRHFRFLDDNAIIDKKRFQELAPKLHDLDIRFRGSISSVLVNPEYCELLYYAGCREIGIGFESADDNILKIVNKAGKATTNMHSEAIKMIQKAGMKAKIYIITGLPGETEESIDAIKRFVIDLKPDKYIVSLFTPYPGTPIFNNPEFYKAEILHKKWREYDGDWPAVSVVNIDGVTHDVFEKRFEDLTVWLRTHDKESFTKGLSDVHDHYEYSSMY
jgi:anaerobic magnesium-protoporphyrin IX monomethyl ester cyclase